MNKDTNIETKLNEYKLGVMDALQKGTFDSRIVDAVTAIMNVDSKESFEKLEKEILVGSLANPFVDCVLKDIVNILEIKDLYDVTISKVAEDFKTQQVAEQIQLSKFMEEYIELNKDSTFEQLKLNITDDVKSEPIDVFKMGYALSKVLLLPVLFQMPLCDRSVFHCRYKSNRQLVSRTAWKLSVHKSLYQFHNNRRWQLKVPR